MQQLTIIIFFFTIGTSTIPPLSIERAYYWREYNNNIPPDAVPSGSDSSYIGQVYLHGQGIFVVQIFDDSKDVVAVGYGFIGLSLQKTDRVIKILCSKNPKNLTWVASNNKHFHVDMIRRYPLVGGFDHKDATNGMMYIGRVRRNGGIKIGPIRGMVEDAKIMYVDGTVIVTEEQYEVLVYAY